MKRNSKFALAVVILAVVVIVSVVYFLPYLTPESIQVTPQKGFVDSYPSIGFNVTGHLYSRDADLPMNYTIFINGNFLTGGYNWYAATDFFGNFKFTTGQTAMTATPFQTGDTIEMKIIVNENGKTITQDFNMTY